MSGLLLTLAGEGRLGKALGRGKKDKGMEVVLAQNGLIGEDFGAKIPQRHGNAQETASPCSSQVEMSHRNTSHRPFCSLFPKLGLPDRCYFHRVATRKAHPKNLPRLGKDLGNCVTCVVL